jgi:hypothetical protein
MGVQPITAVGEEFDPYFHEAVATVDSEDTPANTVVEELLRGYRIGTRVVRHSMVKVVAARPAAAAPPDDFVPDLDGAEPDEPAADDEFDQPDDFVPNLDGDEDDGFETSAETAPSESEFAKE